MGWDSILRLKKNLEPNIQKFSDQLPVIPSSVLVLIGSDGQKADFVLTKRTQSVMTHKGQVSFPGGYREPGDVDLLATALRESQEEIGLQADMVDVLGFLEPVNARGIVVSPWVALMKLPYSFTLNPNEVERIIYLPVDRLLTEGLSPVNVEEPGIKIQSKGIRVGDDLIWGATARMLELVKNYLY